MNYDEIPEWIKTASQELENGHLEKLNFLKGTYIGHALKIADLEQRVEELEEQVELSRAFERERIAKVLEGQGITGSAVRIVRESDAM